MTETLPGRPTADFSFGLVIFDCDGVLVDSEIIAAETLGDMLGRHGRSLDRTTFLRLFLGRSFKAVEEDFRETTGRSLPEGFAEEFRVALERAFTQRLQPIAGIAGVLSRLQAEQRPFALASSSSLPRIAHSLAVTGLAPFFEGRVFSSSMVARGKPFPDLFLHVASTLGTSPATCLVVEDSLAGVTAGRAAGMTVWGFTGGQHHAAFDGAAALREAGASRILTAMDRFFEG